MFLICKSDVSILIDDKPFTNFTVKASTIIKPVKIILVWASSNKAGDTTYKLKTLKLWKILVMIQMHIVTSVSSNMALHIKPGSAQTGVQTANHEYDYSELGETWS